VSGWILEIGPDIEPRLQRAQVSLCALANGTFAVIGDVDVDAEPATRLTLVAGAYGSAPDGLVRPLPGPSWTGLGVVDPAPHRWLLDLRAGTLTREPEGDGLRVIRFVSVARPRVGALRAEAATGTVWAPPLTWPRSPAPLAAMHWWSRERVEERDRAETGSDRATVVVSACQREHAHGDRSRLDRIVAVTDGRAPSRAGADGVLEEACEVGFDALLIEHRAAWEERWRHADIEIEGDPDAQLAVRFALFHLLCSAATEGEAAVGARGLTGLAYAGHVFWDTDVYVLPALAATLPEAARAVLEYRIRRLPAARAAAAERSLPGARFPWESADTGADATPRAAFDLDGRLLEIHTGELAEHITSDVAWAALHYVDWTGDDALLAGPGRSLVTDTARYLQARVRLDEAGRGHLEGVIGPDEYHVGVDDNAYTNGLARWHLRRAAALLRHDGDADLARQLEGTAEALVDGYDPATGRHEQFAGAWALDPVRIADIADVPVAADVLLGPERAAASRVLKQADVLMLHHLLDDELPPGSLAADLDDELPYISHGSSLSPAICAAVLARAGRPDAAMPLFDLAARMDLDDLTERSALGLHLATMGGLWQAVVFGFAGIRPTTGGLRVDPHLPSRWRSLRVRLRYRGVPVTVDVDHGSVSVDAPAELPVLVAGTAATAPLRHPTPPPVGRSTR